MASMNPIISVQMKVPLTTRISSLTPSMVMIQGSSRLTVCVGCDGPESLVQAKVMVGWREGNGWPRNCASGACHGPGKGDGGHNWTAVP